MLKEKWKPLQVFKGTDYTGYYEISTLGRIRSVDRYVVSKNKSKRMTRGIVLKKRIATNGYYYITLSKNNVHVTAYIHRMVAETFINNGENKENVNHKDCDKLNNNVKNLEWATVKENVNHAIKNGLRNRKRDKKGKFI